MVEIWYHFNVNFYSTVKSFLYDIHTLVYFCVLVWIYNFTTGILSQEHNQVSGQFDTGYSQFSTSVGVWTKCYVSGTVLSVELKVIIFFRFEGE